MGLHKKPYPKEFRSEAVRLVKESGESQNRIAKDLGVALESLRSWVKQADLDSGKRSDGLTSEESEELRREVRTLRMEREILKKAAAFFARETEPKLL
jgi:transposase